MIRPFVIGQTPLLAIPPCENPFRVRQTKPGTLRYLFPEHQLACVKSQDAAMASLVSKIIESFSRFERGKASRLCLRGPHGTGKTTLLGAVQRIVEPTLGKAITVTLSSAQSRKDRKSMIQEGLEKLQNPAMPFTWLIIDGIEQLDRFMRWSLARRLDQMKKPSLVTSHQSIRQWPSVYQTKSTAPLVHALVETMLDGQAIDFSDRIMIDLAQRKIDHSTNLRDLWFDLYDLVSDRDFASPTEITKTDLGAR